MSNYPYNKEGCGNHGCEIAPVPKGAMGTNAPCQCVKNKPHIASGVIRWQRERIADLERQVKTLQELKANREQSRDAWIAEAKRLRAELDKIERVAQTGTVQNWLKLPDEEKAKWFAIHVRDSERLKKAEQQLAEAQKDTERAQWKNKSIIQLANDMQYKLDKNKHKNTGWHIDGVKREDQGWLPPACPLEFLVRKYYEEVGEFMELVTMACLDGDVDAVDIRHEAADVANLVMMMRDSVLVMIDASIDRAQEKD